MDFCCYYVLHASKVIEEKIKHELVNKRFLEILAGTVSNFSSHRLHRCEVSW